VGCKNSGARSGIPVGDHSGGRFVSARPNAPRAVVDAANELTRLAAELDRQFQPQVPVEVTVLDHDGRELELWSGEGNAARLNATRSKLRETWGHGSSRRHRKGGDTEAAQFDALIAQLTRATTPKDFAATATPILDSVDLLENVFTRALRRPSGMLPTKRLLKLHRYAGLLTAPVILFFAISGILQVFRLQDDKKSGYKAPEALKAAADFHMVEDLGRGIPAVAFRTTISVAAGVLVLAACIGILLGFRTTPRLIAILLLSLGVAVPLVLYLLALNAAPG
jgi:hypothetical protein